MTEIKPRIRQDLNTNWKFSFGRQGNAWLHSFDDSQWQTVTVPHDWSVTQPFSQEHSSGTGYLPGGRAFYRKRFSLPATMAGKRAVLTFDGVYKNSEVWLNGYYLGKRPSGYATFSYDVSHCIRAGDMENLLAVRVTHEDIADSRWFTGSGLYRKVTLTLTESVAVATDGFFITTEKIEADKAILHMETTLANYETDKTVKLRQSIVDNNDQTVAVVEQTVQIKAASQKTEIMTVSVNAPKLWSEKTPDLYRCRTQIMDGERCLDELETVFGIRTFRFDPDQGFFINGRNLKLKGVCVHHDAGCLGAAVRKKVWQRRLERLKELGCNAIRMSHNPHMPELYDLCDEMGFLVIDEAFDEWEGVKNKWVNGHNVYPPSHEGYAEEFPVWHEADLKALILRDRNHPSVILWSIGNEIDYPNDPYVHPAFAEIAGNNDKNKPKRELMYDNTKPHADRLTVIAKRLSEIVKSVDTTRPVTAALAAPELSNLTGLADSLEVAGYNYKEHLYQGDHEKYPQRIIMGSENGKFIEQWQAVANNDYISGLFLWTGYDFLGETRGWPSHGSEAGLLDIAGFPKPAYYLWQSFWQEETAVRLFTALPDQTSDAWRGEMYSKHISRSWNYPLGETVKVFCFTNADQAELFLNDQSIGVCETKNESGYLSWQVPFQPGKLSICVKDDSGKTVEDELVTVGGPTALQALCYDESIRADGQDIMQIELSVVDEQGNLVDRAQNQIHVSVTGAGSLLGLENGDLTDYTPYTEPYRRAYHGKLLIYVLSSEQPGTIEVHAKSEMLKEVVVTIEAEA